MMPAAATLRARLIAAAAAATIGAVAVLGVSVLVLVDHELHSSLDTTLRSRAVDVARLAVSAPAVLNSPGALEAPYGGRDLSVEVVDRFGRIYARSLSLGGRVLPGGPALTAALSAGRAGFTQADLGGEPLREYVAPLADAGGPVSGGAVLVGSSLSEIDDTITRLRVLVALSALAAGLLGAAGAALLTQRGLRPLRRLADGAREIADTHDPSRRLPVGTAGGELSELAQTLNRMLDSLERARATERRFLADASHELRTPLTSLRGNAAYVARHGADAGALDDIEADAARLARLLDDLLALEREDGAQRPDELVDLGEIVDAVCAGQPGVRIAIERDATVRGEPGALERALRNLVENARLHGPPDQPVDVSLSTDGNLALLAVSDRGPGLDPAQVELAFQRFWRGPATDRPGSGLGLSIVAATAARHGGRVRVDGARFTLELPLAEPFPRSTRPATRHTAPTRPADPATRGKPAIRPAEPPARDTRPTEPATRDTGATRPVDPSIRPGKPRADEALHSDQSARLPAAAPGPDQPSLRADEPVLSDRSAGLPAEAPGPDRSAAVRGLSDRRPTLVEQPDQEGPP